MRGPKTMRFPPKAGGSLIGRAIRFTFNIEKIPLQAIRTCGRIGRGGEMFLTTVFEKHAQESRERKVSS